MNRLSDISKDIKEYATGLGFDLVGISPAVSFQEHNYFLDWISDGFGGEMKYLEKSLNKRTDINEVLPDAKSVVSCAINYNTQYPYSTETEKEGRAWIARYAWGDDYHDVLLKMLSELKCYLFTVFERELNVKAYVDTGPVLEKVYAKYAGIGWIGKNSCLINQDVGSWLLVGELITDVELEYDTEAVDRCGTCTKCIQSCPTDAIVKPYVVDSNRCISYLTIELKDEIPFEIRDSIDNNIFGCDICQDVCPWNRKTPISEHDSFQPRRELFNPSYEYLLELNREDFSQLFKGSPIKRSKRKGFYRNILVALGNAGQKKYLPYVERLLKDEEPLIRLHAVWALWKIEGSDALNRLRTLKDNEQDEDVIKEIEFILNFEG